MAISITTYVAAAAIAGAVIVAGLQTVRLASEQTSHAQTRESYAQQGHKAAERALVLQQERDKAREDLGVALASIDARENAKLKEAENETNRLRDCLRRGTCGLRIAAVCPANPGGVVPAAAAGGGLDSGAGAGLTPQAEQDYFLLRSGISSAQRKLAACQSTLREITEQTLAAP
jgi:hypothetical protein